jgi:hypothetical protein
MPASALVDLSCPHCHEQFVENAKLVRPTGNAWCPRCGRLFSLDTGDEQMLRILAAAKTARRRRRERLHDLSLRWTDPAPARAPSKPPMLMTDVLAVLDDLLERLDGLHRRGS